MGPEGVRLKPSDALTADAAAMVYEVSETAHGVKLRTKNPIRALELLGRHQGLWNDKLELSGTASPFANLSDAGLEARTHCLATTAGYVRPGDGESGPQRAPGGGSGAHPALPFRPPLPRLWPVARPRSRVLLPPV